MSRNGRCEHGRMLRHAPEPTTSTAATSGRPSGLHPTASHTASMVTPSDPGVRAAKVGGFIFVVWEPHPPFGGSHPRKASRSKVKENNAVVGNCQLQVKAAPRDFRRLPDHLSLLSLSSYLVFLASFHTTRAARAPSRMPGWESGVRRYRPFYQ